MKSVKVILSFLFMLANSQVVLAALNTTLYEYQVTKDEKVIGSYFVRSKHLKDNTILKLEHSYNGQIESQYFPKNQFATRKSSIRTPMTCVYQMRGNVETFLLKGKSVPVCEVSSYNYLIEDFPLLEEISLDENTENKIFLGNTETGLYLLQWKNRNSELISIKLINIIKD